MQILLTDLEQLGESALAEFNQRVAQLDRGSDFARQVERLEAKLEQLYAVAVTLARHEERLDQVEAIWARMVGICDTFAQAVSVLRQRHQAAGPASHDRILDIRNECEENRALHA
jgi:hypothetical protein